MSLSYPDAGVALFYPTRAKAVDVSAVDFDVTANTAEFPLGFITSIYVGGPGNVAVLHAGDTVAVTYTAPPVGSYITGAIQKILHSGTTATLLVARGF